jgi:hypothetical protein
VAPVQVSQFHRDERYRILPAYAQDGIMLSRVFRRATDATLFEDVFDELLHHCGRRSEPKSVLVMDNSSFHHTERIGQLCAAAGVKLVNLPPYSPDLDPIVEFLAELKGVTPDLGILIQRGASLKEIPCGKLVERAAGSDDYELRLSWLTHHGASYREVPGGINRLCCKYYDRGDIRKVKLFFPNGASLDILAEMVFNLPGRKRPRSREAHRQAHRHYLMHLRWDLGLSPGDIRRSRAFS